MGAVLFWAGFGIAVRFWQLGIEMRPWFHSKSLLGYPIFAGVGASFGYWLDGVEKRHAAILNERLAILKQKRQRQDERVRARQVEMEQLSEQARKDRLADAGRSTL